MREMTRVIMAGILAMGMCSTALAESAGGVSWTAPSTWKNQGARPMRAATYTVPAAAGDSEAGECAVYYFGPGQGGSAQANVKRWIGQFQAPDGGPADKLAKTSTKTVGALKVTTIELSGTYLYKASPMSREVTKKPGYRMVATIVEGGEGPVFFKLTAPEKTARAAAGAFGEMMGAVKK
jgi:hypothetical protein